jgi:dipeptidyl aminopeptidase/acylaminoacyl peptidase
MIRKAGFLLFAILLTAPGNAAAQEKRPLGVDDLFRLKSVGSPSVSPDGEWVAYTVTTTSLEKEKSETRIWMAAVLGGEPIPLTASGGSAGNPQWSPDGRYLSFTASRGDNAKTQVWTLDRRGGEAQQLTKVEQGVGGYAWSPDGTRLALTVRDAAPEDTLQGARAKTTKPYVIDRLQFKRDYAGYLTGDRHMHLYVFDIEADSLIQITDGSWDESSPAWSPDGRRIAFVSNRTGDPDTNSNSDIFVLDADGSGTPLQLTTNPGSDGSPAWSPDGGSIVFTRNLEPELIWYDVNELAIVSSSGGRVRSLTGSLDRNVRAPAFTEDGSGVRVILEDSGESQLAVVNARSGRLVRLIEGGVSVSSYDAEGGTVAANVSTLQAPGEIHLLDADGIRRLTHANDAFLDGIAVAAARKVEFSSPDGTQVEGFVTFPAGYQEGQRYPTLLRIHGGPVAQFQHRWSFEAQLFAAKGYLVLQTNPRGSSGYGQAFSQALWADWGGPDFEDVMAGVDFAIAQGWADPDRLGVGGWSYGGILTDHIITKTTRFKAAISGASEVLYVANYGHDHYQRQWEAELGLPWENREAWERISPFNDVDRVSTPTLLMGGQDDWNVPIQNSEQMYQALRRLGVDTQLIVYPRQGHGIRVPSYQLDRYQRYLDWYDRYLKPGGDGA